MHSKQIFNLFLLIFINVTTYNAEYIVSQFYNFSWLQTLANTFNAQFKIFAKISHIKNRHFQYFQYLKPPSKEMSRHKSIKFVLQKKEKIGMSMVQIA